jgi:SAM-dependent methyltransferase
MTSTCPLCHGKDLTLCFARERVPVFQNVRYETRAEALAAAVGRLLITHCNNCGFVFNAGFDTSLAVYSPRYENDQTVSPAFCLYLDEIADRVLGRLDPGGGPVVLEVGCGQGHFLKRLAQLPSARVNRLLGFDPAWRGGETGARIEIQPRIFDADATREIGAPIGTVVSRHVIEHVSDPVAFLRDIRVAAEPNKAITLMIETPCLEWIVRNAVMFDFFYEHCNYFTGDTLAFALRGAGYRVRFVEPVFNGQYLWAEAIPMAAPEPTDQAKPIGLADPLIRLGQQADTRLAGLRDRLAELGRKGGVALWGAGAKGATLAALADPDAARIDCLIDINPRKQNTFLAMTAHPILPPEDAAARGVRTVLLLNPNYRTEVERMIHESSLPFDLLDAP